MIRWHRCGDFNEHLCPLPISPKGYALKTSDVELNGIKANTDSGERYFPIFQVEIRDKSNDLVA